LTLPRRAGRAAGGLLLILACLLLAVYFPEVTYTSRTLVRLHDFAHLPVFCVVALIMVAIWPGGLFVQDRLRPLPALRLWLAALLAGILVELLQARQGRVPQMTDIVTDGGGAAIALFLAVGLRGGRWRWTLPPALAMALAFATPVLLSAWDEELAKRQFPLLADLETRLQTDRFGSSRSRLRRITDPESPGNHFLQVRFLPDLFPRFNLRDLPRDWSGFSAFTFTCINSEAEPFYLIVRVDDIHHDNRPADRYTLRVNLPPGRHVIEVPLTAVATAPDTRPMDMTAIARVILYGYKLETPRVLLFDDFRLVP
jgi:hypothetical protein